MGGAEHLAVLIKKLHILVLFSWVPGHSFYKYFCYLGIYADCRKQEITRVHQLTLGQARQGDELPYHCH